MGMWTLVVLILGIVPPQGMVLTGFPDKAACVEEGKRYCDGEKKFRCKCIIFQPEDH